MEGTNITFSFLLFFFLLMGSSSFVVSFDGPLYDPTAYTECKLQPEEPLYGGGIIVDQLGTSASSGVYSPSIILHNLTQGTIYCFSSWVKIEGAGSGLIRASLKTENEMYNCVGTVLAKHGCWSFLKGGFVLNSPSQLSILFFQNADDSAVNIEIASSSLQPFSVQQWNAYREYMINTKRKRAVTVHVSDMQGKRLQGAAIDVEQVSKDFPFGSAIAKTILGNLPYQNWFSKRFNAAVFENELKWYATEPEQGKTNYTVPDQMLQFVRANQVIARGHNIFWEDPKYTPPWVRNLTGSELHLAVNSRIQSLMSKYREEFVHWDVSNEMLHFDFYEQKLGPNATLHFFETAHKSDPLATLFMNDFNVLETCSDINSTVDSYISRLRELRHGGALMDGIGLEGHFTVPNLPLMRAILDKLATLGLPIWLTEVDISSTLDKETQAIYLEQVLREGFSHPSVNGIMLWAALHTNGCYQMCLTDNNLQNLPAGDVVDKLLKEWQTGEIGGQTDEHGSYSFYGFLGEYKGKTNYTVPDQMLQFVRANQVIASGHNIFWEDPEYTLPWVRNLTGSELQLAVNSRIQSLMSKYREEFVHWDVSNEMLHFDFYEPKLGPNATLHFFEMAHKSDPLATLFMNVFNVLETCSDVNSTFDSYISRLRELRHGGALMDGIGLEGHFTVPNLPLMRAIFNKLATLGLPIWLTEVDISSTLDKETQAIYLERVLREGFSHPSVNGIMLWTALHPNGCYQMCLIDNNLQNLPAGDVVDKFMKECQTGEIEGQTDEHGSYSFYGFLGEYRVSNKYGNRTSSSTFSLCQGEETRDVSIQL